MSSKKTVHVAVGVIQRHSISGKREILISKRHDDVHQGGLWEFPGGKVESGESLPQALSRELEEELGLILDPSDDRALSPLIEIHYDYGDKAVLLDVWMVTGFSNAPDDGLGQEGQQVKWVDVESLNDFSFPAANVPIISACQLPDQYIITPIYESLDIARERLSALSKKHSGLILFRQPNIEHHTYFEWLDELLDSIPALRERLMLSAHFADNADTDKLIGRLEKYIGRVKGIHFPATLAKRLNDRVFGQDVRIAISCHSLEELKLAQDLNADFVTLSPVRETSSHPEAQPLGWSQFEEWVKLATIPVYALGGMSVSDLTQSFRSGAQGIAGISTWSTDL
jgi:8-oxo-dGTP diphosphatase